MELTSKRKGQIAARKRRWLEFYDRSRPPSSIFLIRWMPDLPERPWPNPAAYASRIEWAWEKYQQQLVQLDWLDDDTLPFLDVYTGTEIFASAFGCPIHYPENDMPFAMPRIHTAEEVDEIEIPGLDAEAIAPLFEAAAELQRRAGGDALLHMIDLQSPMDIAALVWDKTQFYPAMIQSPESVVALASKIKTYLIQTLDAWFARFGQEFISHYPDYYMPDGITISEDEIGAVSGKMFQRYFLPELTELSNRYGGIGLHCCANARHQWANIQKVPGLRMINLIQPDDVIREGVPIFAETAAQWHSYQGDGPAWTWPAQHTPRARMVYEIFVQSRDEALETAARMREVLRKM